MLGIETSEDFARAKQKPYHNAMLPLSLCSYSAKVSNSAIVFFKKNLKFVS